MTKVIKELEAGAWRLVLVEMTPLEWEENKSAREKICKQWLANTPFGTIWIEHKKKFWISSDGVGQWRIYHETLEHAKAAAQADYEARILSALSASPDATSALLAEIEGLRGAGWRDISTHRAEAIKGPYSPHVLCAHAEKQWQRFGRYDLTLKRWYYSGTSERSQWAQVEGDEPTHWMPMPEPPARATKDRPND